MVFVLIYKTAEINVILLSRLRAGSAISTTVCGMRALYSTTGLVQIRNITEKILLLLLDIEHLRIFLIGRPPTLLCSHRSTFIEH